jgi:hypothetical protein
VFSLLFLVSKVQRTFVTLQFACPMTQKLLNLVMEGGKYWKMFGDGQSTLIIDINIKNMHLMIYLN